MRQSKQFFLVFVLLKKVREKGGGGERERECACLIFDQGGRSLYREGAY